MEFFLPSLLILVISAVVVFAFIPRLAPIILLILSIALLSFGVYHHYSIFKDEYRFSTWQESLKSYGPAGIIVVIVVMLILFILSFFNGVSVPVPAMPELPAMPAMPAMPELPSVTEALNTMKNAMQNTVENIKSNIMGNETQRNINTGENRNQNANRRRNIPQSFFEEI
jgi:hypothetical protein